MLNECPTLQLALGCCAHVALHFRIGVREPGPTLSAFPLACHAILRLAVSAASSHGVRAAVGCFDSHIGSIVMCEEVRRVKDSRKNLKCELEARDVAGALHVLFREEEV